LDAGTFHRQGYLSSVNERVVRVRIAGDRGFLTVKGLTTGVSRLEFEYPIPLADTTVMLDQLCERPVIDKTRHREVFAGRTWEIDIFHGDNDGLVVAKSKLRIPTIKSNCHVGQEPRFRMTRVTSTTTLRPTRIGIGGTLDRKWVSHRAAPRAISGNTSAVNFYRMLSPLRGSSIPPTARVALSGLLCLDLIGLVIEILGSTEPSIPYNWA